MTLPKTQSAQPTNKKQPLDLATLLSSDRMKKELALVLPKHMTSDRMARIALTEVRRNPKLAQVDPMSFIGSLMLCSELGLEPGSARGHVYLIPFYNSKKSCYECQVIPGFKGLMDLARRSGQISTIRSEIVYERDGFKYETGLKLVLKHTYADGDRGPLKYVYAVAEFKDGGYQVEVMSKAQIDKIRDGLTRKNPVWDEHYEEMARKTVIRRLYKYLPSSPEMAQAAQAVDDAYSGEAQENYLLVDPNYEPVKVANEREAAKAEAGEKQKDTLLEKIEDEIVRVSAITKMTAETVAKEVGVKDIAVLPTLAPDRLQAILEALKDMPGGLTSDEIPFGNEAPL